MKGLKLSITEELQNEQGRIPLETFLRWWTAFISYQPSDETPTNPPAISQEPTKPEYVEELRYKLKQMGI